MDIEALAKERAGNWKRFPCFAWHGRREDAANWTIGYTSGRDAGLLAQSNHAEISQRLTLFMAGPDADVVQERHFHWAVGHLDGFAIRVFQGDGSISPAFEEWCRVEEALDNYPILNEADYSEREYVATLENYTSELGPIKDQLQPDWQQEVYSWFSNHGRERFIENRDDQGGYAPRERIVEALQDLGLLPTVVIEPGP